MNSLPDRPAIICSVLLACAWSVAQAAAPPLTHLQVRILTGSEELTAGSVVELRIYEAGKSVRRLPLTHGESWPRESTRLIPLTLAEPLDPRAVVRFALYYRSGSASSRPWEVAAAEVNLPSDRGPPEHLLNAPCRG